MNDVLTFLPLINRACSVWRRNQRTSIDPAGWNQTACLRGRRSWWRGLSLLALSALQLHAAAEDPEGVDLGELSLEELMNITVTSVSKKEQKLNDAAAAVSVLSNDDIRRSGGTSIMEALRMVPGVNVGQVNSSQWAVSARGFNSAFSNKLLVLVDGRAVYSSLLAGVFWDLQQTMLDDVDRIEVIRGPGATVWGANAVNGVINVVTRNARDTQGGLVYGGAGGRHELLTGVRYGGQSGANTHYRVFAAHRKGGNFPFANGATASDGWDAQHGGFRVDHELADDAHLTWQADATHVDLDDNASRAYSFNTLGRWTRQFSERSGFEVQAYFDRVFRDETARVRARSDTVDFAAQQTFALSPEHDVIWGAGYRHVDHRMAQTSPLNTVRRARARQPLFSAFLQDEFSLIPDKLVLTAGVKLEHNDYTGWEFQPGVRAVFKPTRASTVWAAVSRAVRTPSAIEGKDLLGITAAPPFRGPDGRLFLPTIVGNAEPDSEVLRAYEAGSRFQVFRHVSVDLAIFYNEYRDQISYGGIRRLVPGTPLGIAEIPFANLRNGETRGGEAAVVFSPFNTWRLTASYAGGKADLVGGAGPNVPSTPTWPRHQVSLRSSHDFTPRVSLDVLWRYVSALPTVGSYATADFRLAYRWSDDVELSFVGQDLFDRQHPEQGVQQSTVTTEVPRSFHGKATWRF